MKPNSPITRNELMRIIGQSLDDVATGNDATLGAVVRQIMATMPTDDHAPRDPGMNSIPVPLYDVAAYVDGTLADPQKLNDITAAATTDPGLMMEIVSALQSRREVRTEAISSDLRSRLLAMHPGPPQLSTPPIVQPASVTEIKPHVAAPAPGTQNAELTQFRWGTIALLVTAAAVFFVVGWWARSGMSPQDEPTPKDPGGIHRPELANSNPTKDADPGSRRAAEDDSALVQVPEPKTTPPQNVTPDKAIDAAPDNDVAIPPSLAVDPTMQVDDASMAATGSSADRPTNPRPVQPDSPTIAATPDSAAPLSAQWTQIDGLLLRSVSTIPSARSSSGEAIPRGVGEGTGFRLAADDAATKLKLQTLPLCRATAALNGGGELVLSAETQLELTDGGVIDLQYGSLALLELNPTANVRIGTDADHSVSLASPGGGAIVVRRTLTGLEVDVSGEPVNVGDQSFVDSRLQVDATTFSVQRIDDAPERLPRWTRERVDRIEVGRNVLAQLSESPDVRVTMMQSLASGAVRGDAATTLRAWLVAASGDDLIRLIGSQDALLREAALQYLLAVNPTDPRHRLLWRGMQARASNARNVANIRSYFVDLWSNRRPNPTRRDQLLRMLQASDAATRVTANYFLRAFYGPGPRFDLNASATARTRAANAWRVVISRVSD